MRESSGEQTAVRARGVPHSVISHSVLSESLTDYSHRDDEPLRLVLFELQSAEGSPRKYPVPRLAILSTPLSVFFFFYRLPKYVQKVGACRTHITENSSKILTEGLKTVLPYYRDQNREMWYKTVILFKF